VSREWTAEEVERGRLLFAGPVQFVMGVAGLDQLPLAERPEVAFAGRSNAGKSSLINALAGRRDLARTSNTPGRTRELNFFDIGGRLILVDMPGYGYAKAAKVEVRKWQALLRSYLRGRPGLARAFVLVDARHGVMSADEEMMSLLDETAVTYQFVLTKIDKIKPAERASLIAATNEIARKRPAAYPFVHATSSVTSEGIAELRAEIAELALAGLNV
jgi:GTP-binding protein